MTEKVSWNSGEVDSLLESRGQRIRAKFEEEIMNDVENKKLLEILKAIIENRKDNFRPTLTSLACEAVGGKLEDADNAGLMFTLVSTGISIHDDIIDKTPRKHLRLTILGKYGINKSLLAGDLLIVKGWAQIGKLPEKNVSTSTVSDIAKIYGTLSTEMCEAEFSENERRKKVDNKLEVHQEILWKEMAEMEACTRVGAILGSGSIIEVEALAEFGRRLGFTSRLADELKDTLNIEGGLVQRLKHESVPLPLLYAAKSNRNRHQKMQSIVKKSDFQPSDIKTLLEIYFDSNAYSYIHGLAEKNVKAARNCLRAISPSQARNAMVGLNEKLFASVGALNPANFGST